MAPAAGRTTAAGALRQARRGRIIQYAVNTGSNGRTTPSTHPISSWIAL